MGSLTTSGKALRSRGSDSGRWWWGPRSASGGQAASSPGQAADSVHTVSHPPAPPQSHRAPHIARPPGIVTPRFPWDREPSVPSGLSLLSLLNLCNPWTRSPWSVLAMFSVISRIHQCEKPQHSEMCLSLMTANLGIYVLLLELQTAKYITRRSQKCSPHRTLLGPIIGTYLEQ